METSSALLDDLDRDESFLENDKQTIPPNDVVAFTESRSCADLLRMYQQQILNIQPDFQRELVWSQREKTRFVDSLAKQLPIPSLCLSLDYKTQKWQVIDGLQRISTIVEFLTNESWKLSTLDDINPIISGKKAADFSSSPELIAIRQIIENLSLPITVIRCDYSEVSHQDYLFEIFHRLNTGGTKLNNQEIRNCIYSGLFNDLLNTLNDTENWKKIMGRTPKRYKGQELILRFLALNEKLNEYDGKLASFLNYYMATNRDPNSTWIKEKTELFNATVDLIESKLDSCYPFSSVSIFEGVFVGISNNLEYIETLTANETKNLFSNLTSSSEYSKEALSQGLSQKIRLKERIKVAISIFGALDDKHC